MPGSLVTVFLCGDVMLGRGVDQILPHPGDPKLLEAYVRNARTYVELAETVNGPLPHAVDFIWPWGDALRVLEGAGPDARIVNLETSITRSDDFAPGKAVHYRMNPANLPCLAAVRPDVCVLANNHVLDFGRRGLEETLDTLSNAGLLTAGAGRDVREAQRPAVLTLEEGRRVVVLAMGMASSGIPPGWAATDRRPGVDFLLEASTAKATEVAARMATVKRPGDVAIVSIHWGSNWGYDIERDHIRFAHALIDGGIDIVHGHSSHHPRPIEVYRQKLILYGCGDFVDDYEGISGHGQYRDDLRLLYLASVEPATGSLVRLRMEPFQARMQLRRAGKADCEWLREVLDQVSSRYGTRVDREPHGTLIVRRSEA